MYIKTDDDLYMLPKDILRVIADFLLVKECLNLQVACQLVLFEKIHYQNRIYSESIVKFFLRKNIRIMIATHRMRNTVFSMVRNGKKEFLIRHTEEISTKNANNKVLKLLKSKNGINKLYRNI